MSNRKKIVKAVIPAAGFGTRMLPATKVVPKEMLPVAGKPLIEYAIEEAAAAGIEMVVIVVRETSSLIKSHLSPNGALESFLNHRGVSASSSRLGELPGVPEIQFVEQKRPLGLADALLCARPFIGDESFAVLLPDVIMVSPEPVVGQLLEACSKTGGSVLAIRKVEPQDVQRFGIVRVTPTETDSNCGPVRISGLLEKPLPERAPSNLGVFGRYILESSIWEAIARTGPDANGEVQLTDALHLLCQRELLFGVCFEGRHYDAGDRVGYLKANIELSLQDPRLRPSILEYFQARA